MPADQQVGNPPALRADEALVFLVEGSAFEATGYDLRLVERLLTDYRRLVDNTLPLAVGQRTLTDKIRQAVTYQVTFERGSWRTLLELVLEHKELLAAIAAVHGAPEQLAQYVAKVINGVLELRRILDAFLEKGEKPNVKLASENQVSVPISFSNVQTNGGDIIVSPVILMAAETTRSTLDNLINAVDGRRVTKIKVKSGATETTIRPDDRRLTGRLREELPKTYSVFGRLNVINADSHRGRLVTERGTFPVTWEESIRDQIRDVVDRDRVVFKVRPIVDNRRLKDSPIGLHIVSCEQPQGELLK